MTGKIAMIGDGDSVTVFQAAGVATFTARDEKTARDTLKKAAQSHQIIFITEELSRLLGDYLKRFDEEPYPVILTVPSQNGTTGYGDELLKNAMERALGVDILFRNE